jgi:hypothetical protein
VLDDLEHLIKHEPNAPYRGSLGAADLLLIPVQKRGQPATLVGDGI